MARAPGALRTIDLGEILVSGEIRVDGDDGDDHGPMTLKFLLQHDRLHDYQPSSACWVRQDGGDDDLAVDSNLLTKAQDRCSHHSSKSELLTDQVRFRQALTIDGKKHT